MRKELIRAIGLLAKTYGKEYGEPYGPVDEAVEGLCNLADRAEQALEEASSQIDAELVVLDWAGIGDAAHSRLIVQHLVRTKEINWIVPPLVAPLYRDDKLVKVVPGFTSPYRDPRQTWIRKGLGPLFDAMAADYLGEHVLNISARVGDYWQSGKWRLYPELFFGGAGVTRDMSIKHQLNHRGSPTIKLPARYVCIENEAITFGCVDASVYKNLSLPAVQLGSSSAERIEGAVDARGMNLYDTFSIVKRSAGFIGRSSGNQSLMAFCRHIPLVELEIPELGSYGPCGYHPLMVKASRRDLPGVVDNFIAKRPK